ncbi:unnamed protein product, partial [Oppiella nova]
MRAGSGGNYSGSPVHYHRVMSQIWESVVVWSVVMVSYGRQSGSPTIDGLIYSPDFWGRLNPKWSLCSRGRRQSPIDINPKLLLFDPNLSPIQVYGDYVNGNLQNSGRGILFKVSANRTAIISGGPLSYQYTLKEMYSPPGDSIVICEFLYHIHYGRENDRGSEHTISGHQFPAEIQLYAFNSQLYANWSSAQSEANGVLAIAVLIAHTQQSIGGNAQLKHITHTLKNITKKVI